MLVTLYFWLGVIPHGNAIRNCQLKTNFGVTPHPYGCFGSVLNDSGIYSPLFTVYWVDISRPQHFSCFQTWPLSYIHRSLAINVQSTTYVGTLIYNILERMPTQWGVVHNCSRRRLICYISHVNGPRYRRRQSYLINLFMQLSFHFLQRWRILTVECSPSGLQGSAGPKSALV